MNHKHRIRDIMLAAQSKTTVPSVQNWKRDRHLPKLKAILHLIEYYSKVSNESPEEILLDLFDSLPEYREMNRRYRERKRNEEQKDD